jgi:DNA (cytosine-5)-methyltransferase 1
MKYFSLFSGIGGFERGIEQATDHIRSLQQKNCKGPEECNSIKNELLRWECVGYSEINRYAEAVYKKHYPEHKNYGDATNIVPELLPDFDFMVAGFPCQSYSVAGKRKGFDDPRGALFFDLARILSYKRPGYILLENVKGLLHHESGKTFQKVLGVLADMGYVLEWQVLNSKDYGVPQNRERIYIIGYLGTAPRPEVFPIGESVEVAGLRENRLKQLNDKQSMGYRVYDIKGVAKTLASNAGGLGAKTGLYLVDPGEAVQEDLTLFSDFTRNSIPTINIINAKEGFWINK